MSVAATCTGSATRSIWRSPISTPPSSSTPPTRAPSTIAVWSSRPRASTPQAIADFSKAISISPSAIEPYNARGLSYLATQDYRAALDDFNEVVKRDRNSYEGWTNQGLALEQLGERQKAFAAFARASTLNANYAPAREGMRRTAGSGSAGLARGNG